MNNRGQEEMVGFALIMVLVMVILLIFIGFTMVGNHDEGIESYEVQSFLGAMLDTTTPCENYYGKLSVGELIQDCYEDDSARCLNTDENMCEVLEREIYAITDSDPNWNVGPEFTKKGYELVIGSEESGEIFNISRGDLMGDYDYARQLMPRVDIYLQVYY